MTDVAVLGDAGRVPTGPWGSWGTRTYIMGIVNCTPDSFSGDGLLDARAAIAHGLRLADEGADVLDVGGESTRPGARPVAAHEELRRVLPVIETLAARAGVPVSIDTSKAVVVAAALRAGATVVNDVWALARDPALAAVVARHQATVVLMHNRMATPAAGALGGYYPDAIDGAGDGARQGEANIVRTVGETLAARIAAADAAGMARDRLIIDPGIGFGKSREQNLALLRRLGELKRHPALAGLPLLAGVGAAIWPARFEVVRPRLPDVQGGSAPTVVIDGAHNGDSARKLAAPLRTHVPFERLWLVLGVGADKDLKAIVAPLAPMATRGWTVAARHPRSRAAAEVAAAVDAITTANPGPLDAATIASAIGDTAAAVRAALAAAGPADAVCVTGSLFVAAEAREALGLVPAGAGDPPISPGRG